MYIGEIYQCIHLFPPTKATRDVLSKPASRTRKGYQLGCSHWVSPETAHSSLPVEETKPAAGQPNARTFIKKKEKTKPRFAFAYHEPHRESGTKA